MQGLKNFKYRIKILRLSCVIISVLLIWISLSIFIGYILIKTIEEGSRFSNLIMCAAGFLVLYSFIGLIFFLSARTKTSRGEALKKSQTPGLFRMINDVAQNLGHKQEISKVFLTPGITINVSYEPNLTNLLFSTSPHLFIGIGLIRILSASELRAVICHELVHYVQPETKYKTYLAHLLNCLNNVRHSLDKEDFFYKNVLTLPAKSLYFIINDIFGAIFDRNRDHYDKIAVEMELEADYIAARTYGADNLISALNKTVVVQKRLYIYKNLILPYLQANDYRCDGFWNTFDATQSFFMIFDKIELHKNEIIKSINTNSFKIDSIVERRLKNLSKGAMKHSKADADSLTYDLSIDPHIEKLMDGYMCLKYNQSNGSIIGFTQYQDILESLLLGAFKNIRNIDDAIELTVKIQEEVGENADLPTIENLPSYAGVKTDPFVLNENTLCIYNSKENECPVCGCEIERHTKVCPYCKEVIAE